MIILVLNAVVPGIPILQFAIMRRPPRGGRALWERLLGALANRMGVSTAIGRRASDSMQQSKHRKSSYNRTNSMRADLSIVPT